MGCKWLVLLFILIGAPVCAQALLPAPSLPLTGAEQISCLQNHAYKGCTPNEIATAPGVAPTLPNRAAIATTHALNLALAGFYNPGDLGAGAVYTSTGCTAGGTMAVQNADGVYVCLALAGQAPVGWFGAHLDYAKNQFTGTISGNNLTFPPSSYGHLVGDPMVIGMTVCGTGVTCATVVSGAGTSWTISGGAQSVGPSYMYAYSGHDDTAALNAAAATKLTVRLDGLPCAGGAGGAGNSSWAGVSSTVTLPNAHQKLISNGCTGIAAMPNFTVGGGTNGLQYVLAMN